MTDYNYIENYIAEFVDRHVSEKIFLNIKPKIVAIYPVKKRGSILLAMFWIKVLQNKNNFPPQCVSYNTKKLSDSELVVLFVEDIMISLNLLTGALQFEGSGVMEWFKSRMMDVIKNYIGLKDTKSFYKDDQSTFNQISSDYNHKIRHHILGADIIDTNNVLENDHLSNLMIDSVLEAACENVRQSSLKQSKSWIYRLWKSLMYKWCSDVNVKIIIVTSQIDQSRLQDIADISLLLRATTQIMSIYVPYYCDNASTNKTISDMTTKVLSTYNPNEKLWIEYEIFNKIVIPKSGVGCNFIAGILPDNKVQMMLTSCRFHGVDIDHDCMHSVQYIEMSELQFDKNFISTLQSP